jgi:glycosyltransferase involved in cell wall biosynthesis
LNNFVDGPLTQLTLGNFYTFAGCAPMKNLLVLNFYPPFLPPRNGGESHLYNFYFEMSRSYNVSLLTSGALDSAPETIWHTNHFVEQRIPKDPQLFYELWQRLAKFAGEGDLSGPCVAECGHYMTQLHRAYLDAYDNADAVIHEFPFTINYDLFLGLDNKPRIYNSNNCESLLYNELHASSGRHEISDLVRDLETKLLRHADLVTLCSPDDLPAFEKILGGKLAARSVHISRAMGAFPEHAAYSRNGSFRAVFMGSGHPPNIEAARFIVDVLAPACPGVAFDVIGSCLPEGVYPKNVHRHGVVSVELKSTLIAKADIAVNPMQSGSGINLKVLEYVGHGTPILSTPFGMRGFQFPAGEAYLSAELADFASQLQWLTQQPATLTEIASKARAIASERHSWAAITSHMGSLIEQAIELKASSPCEYVLVLNDYDPFVSVGGGGTRLRGLYEATAEWAPVVVLHWSADATFGSEEIAHRIKRVKVPRPKALADEAAQYNSRFHIGADDILTLRHAHRDPVLATIYAVLRTHARIIVCDHPYMAGLPTAAGDRFVYSSQNCEHELKEEVLRWHPDRDDLLHTVREGERLCVGSSALVVAVSEEDAVKLTSGVDAAAPCIVVPNGAALPIDCTFEDQAVATSRIGNRSAVFLGSAHPPNIDAAKFIVHELAPQCPDVEFHIVGGVSDIFKSHGETNVHVWGAVSDSLKSAVLQRCSIAINPMFSGGGSNVKLADYLLNGLLVVTTSFGFRGYPDEFRQRATVTELAAFPQAIQSMLDRAVTEPANLRLINARSAAAKLSMVGLGGAFVSALRNLEQPKKHILFVTSRYTHPPLGGAETMLDTLIAALDASGRFAIDVVAPDVSSVTDEFRFASRYQPAGKAAVRVGLINTRFIRFPVAAAEHRQDHVSLLKTAWRSQSEFEKQLYLRTRPRITSSGLAWGWGYPEDGPDGVARWCFTECGVHLAADHSVRITGFVPARAALRVLDVNDAEMHHVEVNGHIDIVFQGRAGPVKFYFSVSAESSAENDPRPLALYTQGIFLDDEPLNLRDELVSKVRGADALAEFRDYAAAAELSRGRANVRLTDIRGPHAPELEIFLTQQVQHYDLVITHNSVLRPPVAAISAAKVAGVPSILIPHAHLDDDYYHFPDVYQCALAASKVLAAPRAACAFFREVGCNDVGYLPAGVDTKVEYSERDLAAFEELFQRQEPFFLVLGRKSAAKGYAAVIDAIEELALTTPIHLVLIGPDDDNVEVISPRATYLGHVSRAAVRGALMSCVGLVNMSTSESFGIVILEAWLAKRPVIVNRDCAAFGDLVEHQINGLLVAEESLLAAMRSILENPLFGSQLGERGRLTAEAYDLARISADFVASCDDLIYRSKAI